MIISFGKGEKMKSIRNALSEATKQLLQKRKIEMFCIGFMMGLIASWIYLLAGGQTWLFVPSWAEIVFYPGFFVGGCSYNLFLGKPLAVLIGTLTVGLFYGTVFVTMLLLGRFLRHRKKYVIVLLCITTVVIGISFLKKLFLSSDISAISYLRQDFTLTITADQPGANVYPLQGYWHEPAEPIGTTPLTFDGFYRIDRVGTGWMVSGKGIRLKSTEDGFLVLLDCIVAKNGYLCKEVAPVLATLPKNIQPDQMPSEFNYNAKLIPEESPHVNKIGTAVMVNGSFLEVNPPSLKMNEGVYIIDIKSAK